VKYITRIDQAPSNHLWWVRFYYGTNKKGVSKQKFRAQKGFFDSHYDYDYKRSLQAAKEWRDEQIRLNPKWGERVDFKCKRLKNVTSASSTGVIGVQISNRTDRSKAWLACWRETIDGVRKPRTRSFSYYEDDQIEKKAQFERACMYRLKMEKEHYTGSR